ncbi:MAG: hypothetical protein Q9190_003792 [Brigantiaea leucoxantha]
MAWTLRFKNYKTTILLFVSQTESLTSIKRKLLEAIKGVGLTTINDHQIPSDPEDIVLGVLADNNDASKGWVGLEIPEIDDEEGTASKKKSVLNESPLGAGLKDGTILAFKFRNKESENGEMDLDDNNWDVLIPTYDEAPESQEGNESQND